MKYITPVSVIAIIALSAIVFGRFYLKNNIIENTPVDYSECRLLDAGCLIRIGKASYAVSIEGEVKPLQPFFVLIGDKDNAIVKAELNLKMKAMDMGQNKFNFKPTAQNSWRSTVIVPVCTTGKREWLIELTISDQTMTRVTVFEVSI
ncbi:MAG: hypothetical protein OEY11_11250 [Gammaproteobacteria bacterium]|nr:hypothetical protein [Gammaproteobacteria bacterium]